MRAVKPQHPPKMKAAERRSLLAIGATVAAPPDSISPQLATLATRVPAEEPTEGPDEALVQTRAKTRSADGRAGQILGGESQWIYEIKLDGYRMMARLEVGAARGAARLFTRNGHDWTARMPALASALEALAPAARCAWLDGEAVVIGEDGLPHFGDLQNAMNARRGSASSAIEYFAFDLLHLGDLDLRGVPLRDRRRLLRDLLESCVDERVHFSEEFPHRGEDVLASACKLKLEGVVAKRGDSPYRSGRSSDWLKLKCLQRQEFVVGGFTTLLGAQNGVRALALGVYGDRGELLHAGSVKAAMKAAPLRRLEGRLQSLRMAASPFATPPAPEKDRAQHWVRPELVVEVSFLEWRPGRGIRHGQLQGVREDKEPQSVRRERPVDPCSQEREEEWPGAG